MTDLLRTLTLDNGVHLTLRHAPRLKRSAAALRVHAGSHDAPPKWPGLAHFLEHLFFLGTARFPLEDGLMRYVQSVGGHVNASTRERTTDFFFEVPTTALDSALERLCQMLAEPDLGLERQRREREVIHAEFIAWSRDTDAQHQYRLLQSLSPGHPLSGFHAGNRYSLALADPAFQRALQGFHTRFYHGGQISLSLCGPQSLDALETVARRFAQCLPGGETQVRVAPPALLERALLEPTAAAGRLDLLFAHEQLPPGAEPALDLLSSCLSDSRPGGWLDHVRGRGWVRDFHSEKLYAYAGQLLWHLRLRVHDQVPLDELKASLHDWLAGLRQADLQALNRQFGQLQRSRERAASALELARRDSAGMPFAALDDHGLIALQALLESLPAGDPGAWCIPLDEPLLDPRLPEGQDVGATGVHRSDALPSTRDFATLYLRWQVDMPLSEPLYRVLSQALLPVVERAQRASLQLDFSRSAGHWQLRCAGMPAAVIRGTALALDILRRPPTALFDSPPRDDSLQMPIRALLKALPDALLARAAPSARESGLDQARLDLFWNGATRTGLALGFDALGHAALSAMLMQAPGQPSAIAEPHAHGIGRRWLYRPTSGSEHALLLFCPVPACAQGAGRLLAQALQGRVYQRLRVELQLGYAVFSTFHQVEGQGGLLVGVQSPDTSPARILEHLMALLEEGVVLDAQERDRLAARFTEPAMPNAEVAEWAWQTYLATEPSDLSYLRQSILETDQFMLERLLKSLLNAEHGWLCLATSEAPSEGWQVDDRHA